MCLKPTEVWPKNKRLLVPCGKCLACLSNKRNDWAFRLEQEYKASKEAHFVTLTYDRKNLKKVDYELSKRDLQLYIKRVRKLQPDRKIRYYAVGEYGTQTGRPHYHLLIFNSDEKIIRSSWSDDGRSKGIVHVGKVSSASVRYCLKYMVQPIDKKKKPFSLMSRGYGLGAHYLTDEMVEWHRSGDKNYIQVNGIIGRLPRYYKDKIWYDKEKREKVSDASKWLAIKKSRKELKWFVKRYGKENAKTKMAEFRKAVIDRIKVKVAFTQTI